jgi:hypothetical protein
MWRSGEAFLAGGYSLAVPVGARVRLFARPVSRPGWDLELHWIALGSQQAQGNDTIELLWNGGLAHYELTSPGIGTSNLALPFPRFDAQGILELWITNAAALDSTKTGHVLGRYVHRD